MNTKREYDLLITGAKIVDGTGNPWFYGDVAVSGERVAAVEPAGRIDPALAREVVDAAGLGVLVGVRRRAEAADRTVVLRDTPPRVLRLLNATRLSRLFVLD